MQLHNLMLPLLAGFSAVAQARFFAVSAFDDSDCTDSSQNSYFQGKVPYSRDLQINRCYTFDNPDSMSFRIQGRGRNKKDCHVHIYNDAACANQYLESSLIYLGPCTSDNGGGSFGSFQVLCNETP